MANDLRAREPMANDLRAREPRAGRQMTSELAGRSSRAGTQRKTQREIKRIKDMSDIKIRTASTQDLPAILEIYSYYVLHTAITFEYDVPTLEEFRLRMEQTLRMYPYIVAEEDGNILGYAYAGPFKTRAAYNWSVETSIYVAKEARQKGIGTLLLAHLEALLQRQNILNVNACIAYPKDTGDPYLTCESVRFHEKNGYRLVGRFHDCACKFSRWYDMVWMEKMIGEHITPAPAVIPFPQLPTEKQNWN